MPAILPEPPATRLNFAVSVRRERLPMTATRFGARPVAAGAGSDGDRVWRLRAPAGAPASSGGGSTGSGGVRWWRNGSGPAAAVARKLGRTAHFLVGMGNDLNNDHSQDGAYTLGVTLDLHYAYMVGLPGQGGWPDWNAGGTFVNILSDSADAKGVTPMYTLYARRRSATATCRGWAWIRSCARTGRAQGCCSSASRCSKSPRWCTWSPTSGPTRSSCRRQPSTVPVRVSGLVPECADQPNDLAGLGVASSSSAAPSRPRR